jgi:hypothetical protein
MSLAEQEAVSVEYKIFGPARWPSDDFKDGLNVLLGLNDEQRNAVVQWFLSSRDYDLDMPSLPPDIVASALLPQQFNDAARVIRYLLDGWQSYGLELPEIERDLLLLGRNQEEIRVVTEMLARLSPIKERVWIDGQHGTQLVVGLPTIDDVNLVWDARPVFGDLAYYYRSANVDASSYRRFLGLTYVAILEILSSDTNGQKQRTAVQMDEEQFQRFLVGMKRASEQLDILKKHTKSLVLDTENAQNSE